jgi:hypothetical protein
MSNVNLPLKKKWFEMTNQGIKMEDYREITSYWCNRLLKPNNNDYQMYWGQFIEKIQARKMPLKDVFFIYSVEYKKFEQNRISLGYPKNENTTRIIYYEHAGIEIKEGRPEWGAEPGRLYFVIKHGQRIISNKEL